MTQTGKLFLVDGLDLAGKTSACKNLVARLQPRPEYRRNAPAEKNRLYLAADDLRRSSGFDSHFLGHTPISRGSDPGFGVVPAPLKASVFRKSRSRLGLWRITARGVSTIWRTALPTSWLNRTSRRCAGRWL